MEWYEMEKDQLDAIVKKLDGIRKHKMMTAELRKKFEKQGDTRELSTDEMKVICKFFNPYGSGTWYVVEYDPEDGTCYGYVDLHERELGNFNFYEIATLEIKVGGYRLPLERDKWWDSSTTLKQVMDKEVS